MKFQAAVCGADESWSVPSYANDPAAVLAQLLDGDENTSVLHDGTTHLMLMTRPEWAPAMQRLATLLKAHDGTLNVGILLTSTTPLGAAVVAERVNALALEPGLAARELRRLLPTTRSSLWVRRVGMVKGARPTWWEVIRALWAKEGYLIEGAEPAVVRRADEKAWADFFAGTTATHRLGEFPPIPAQASQQYLTQARVWGRDVSRGARQLTGKQRTVELAATQWSQQPHQAEAAAEACSGCGASVLTLCPFCHAAWGQHAQESLSAVRDNAFVETT